MGQVGLQPGLRHPEPPPAIRGGDRADGRLERPGRVAKAMLAQLRELDPADDGGPPGPGRDPGPGLGRLGVAAEPPEEVRAVQRDPLRRPRSRRTRRSDASSRVRDAPPRRSAEVGPAGATTTARSVARRRRLAGRDAAAGSRRPSDRGVGPSEGLLEAGQGLLRTPGSDEGPGEAGQVPDRGAPARRGARRSRRRAGRSAAGQRPDVLVVVADDGGQRLGRPAAQEAEVAPRDLPAVDVVVALDARAATAPTVCSRASSIRCRNSRRTIGSRSRWPSWAGAGRRAIR